MKRAITTAILLAHFAIATLPSVSRAAAPPLLPVQGYLTDDADAPLNGIYKLNFTLFDAASAGTSIFATSELVTVAKGRFTVYLGDNQQLQLDKLHHANAVWLEIVVVESCGSDASCGSGTPVNKTLSPRLQIASTAFAASAAYCGTADTAQNATTATMADTATNATQLQGMTAAQMSSQLGVPSGMIGMFSATCPTGWSLCDGNGGTPNLVGNYVKAGATFAGSSGSNTHTHTLSGQTSASGGHHHYAMFDGRHKIPCGRTGLQSMPARLSAAGHPRHDSTSQELGTLMRATPIRVEL